MNPTFKDEHAYISEARSLKATGNFVGALEILQAGLTVGKHSIMYNYTFGTLLKETGNFNDAIIYLNRCKKSPIADNQLAECYVNLGELEKGIFYYNRSILNDQFDYRPEIALGEIYVTLQQFEFAVNHFKNALAKNPSNLYAQERLITLTQQSIPLKSSSSA